MVEEDDPWSGPPKATLARRAQSYTDFYHAVTAYTEKKESLNLQRQKSLDSHVKVCPAHEAELQFDEDFSKLEEELIDRSHEIGRASCRERVCLYV